MLCFRKTVLVHSHKHIFVVQLQLEGLNRSSIFRKHTSLFSRVTTPFHFSLYRIPCFSKSIKSIYIKGMKWSRQGCAHLESTVVVPYRRHYSTNITEWLYFNQLTHLQFCYIIQTPLRQCCDLPLLYCSTSDTHSATLYRPRPVPSCTKCTVEGLNMFLFVSISVFRKSTSNTFDTHSTEHSFTSPAINKKINSCLDQTSHMQILRSITDKVFLLHAVLSKWCVSIRYKYTSLHKQMNGSKRLGTP